MEQYNYVHIPRNGENKDNWTLLFHDNITKIKPIVTTLSRAAFEMLMQAYEYFTLAIKFWGELVSNRTFNSDEYSMVTSSRDISRSYLEKTLKLNSI